jgi:hypothetical protein
MLYNLCTSESKGKIGDIILDESPEVGCTVYFAEAIWRVVEIVWMQNVDNNSVSSGLLCVGRIDNEDSELKAAIGTALESDEPPGLADEDQS